MARIGIAGAGLLGRLLAWRLALAGHAVDVYDAHSGPAPTWDGQGASGHTAAGMLSPVAELETASVAMARLGARSVALWQAHAAALQGATETPLVTARGSLLLAHRQDLGAAQRALQRLAAAPEAGLPAPVALQADALMALEPALHGVAHAWRLDGEAQVDAPAMMAALHAAATTAGARWHWQSPVDRVEPARLCDAETLRWTGDVAIDVRGVGARDADGTPVWPQRPLRGVRGETVWLHAPGLGLTRPLRLLHARHRVYVVPRPGDVVIVGASEIESEDRSPVSLKTAVELMTAAHSVLPGLAEARILRLDRHLRPALPDHAPHVEQRPGLLRLNGLFRHGWLLAPALVDDALAEAGLVGHRAGDRRAAEAPGSACPA